MCHPCRARQPPTPSRQSDNSNFLAQGGHAMSLFDYPRINIKGTIQLSPGTANHDDYAGAYVLPDTWGPFAGETLALIDSKTVTARTYGMSDADFIAWV